MKRLWRSTMFLAAILLVPYAHACSCMGRPPCGAYNIQNTLFVGKAVSVRTIQTTLNGIFKVQRRVFHFEVVEVLHDLTADTKSVEVETGVGGGDCGYHFSIGQTYFVDAAHYGQDGALSTGICSGTALESTAVNILREIRAQLKHQRLPDLSGVVYKHTSLANNLPPAPLAGISVQATPAQGNAYTAVTDADGIYSIPNVPPGEYQLTFRLPSGLITYADAIGDPETIKIPGGGSAACHADVPALPSSTISGHVLDPQGKPMGVSGIISLRRPGAKDDEEVSTDQDANGAFKLQFIPPGEYQVVFRLWGHGPVRESWYGSDTPRTVRIGEDSHIEGVDIVAPRP